MCSRTRARPPTWLLTPRSSSLATPFSALNLAHGGHLTHGHPLNFSGKTYKIVPYGVTKETETIDYDDLEKIAEREQPKLIIGGGSAYPRFIDFARMRQIADKVGALLPG